MYVLLVFGLVGGGIGTSFSGNETNMVWTVNIAAIDYESWYLSTLQNTYLPKYVHTYIPIHRGDGTDFV